MLFQDREQAGLLLARRLVERRIAGPGALVLALPRGGVPVAAPIARALQGELDIFLVRKLGVPGHEEYAMGAIASGGLRVLNEDVVAGLGIPPDVIDEVAREEAEELTRREKAYRAGRPFPRVSGRTVIVVDDGLATGATMRAAVRALRTQNPAQLIVAVPVAPQETCEELGRIADRVECLATPEPFRGVGMWYEDFRQTTDREVLELLADTALPDAA